MRRRTFLALAGAGVGTGGLTGLAGCVADSGGESTPASTSTPTDGGVDGGSTETREEEDLPDGVYVQRFRESMAMQGTTTLGEFTAGLMYAAPHRFWNVNGRELQLTERSGDVHLMTVVWDPETNTVLPEAGVSVEIDREGELISQEVVYPMLSQRMGFHYGGNFSLDGDGEYLARVSVGGIGVRRTGAFEGRFDDPTTLEIPFEFDESQRERIRVTELDAYGQRGAVKPMEMGMLPQSFAPAESDLPGVLGRARSDDAVFVVGGTDPPAGVEGERYLYASARTPYNRLVLPAMAVSATVESGGETVHEGALERTFDPTLGYHYGAALDGELAGGETVTLTPTLPPQVARHEGYERAFLEMAPATLRV
jgi:hypothetical protein